MRNFSNIFLSLIIGCFGLWLFIEVAAAQGWATYDLGILQKIFLATVEMPIIYGIMMLFYTVTFPVLFKHVKRDLNEKATQWEFLDEKTRTLEGLKMLRWFLFCYVLLIALQ